MSFTAASKTRVVREAGKQASRKQAEQRDPDFLTLLASTKHTSESNQHHVTARETERERERERERGGSEVGTRNGCAAERGPIGNKMTPRLFTPNPSANECLGSRHVTPDSWRFASWLTCPVCGGGFIASADVAMTLHFVHSLLWPHTSACLCPARREPYKSFSGRDG